MKKIKKIVIVLASIIALLFVVGLFLPRELEISRSISIEKTHIDSAFVLVNDLHKWDVWSPWHDMDPSAVWEYSGDEALGVGAWYSWSGEIIGSGKLTIKQVTPLSLIDMYMEFEGTSVAQSQFIFNTETTPATITWTFSTDMGFNPFSRYFAPFVDSELGAQYEDGLQSLKKSAGSSL